MLQCSFSLVAVQLLVKMTSALQKSECCSAVSAAQLSENCSATSVFACGMLQGWDLEGWGLGLAELAHDEQLEKAVTVDFKKHPRTGGLDKVQESVDPRFVAGLPFPVSEI